MRNIDNITTVQTKSRSTIKFNGFQSIALLNTISQLATRHAVKLTLRTRNNRELKRGQCTHGC